MSYYSYRKAMDDYNSDTEPPSQLSQHLLIIDEVPPASNDGHHSDNLQRRARRSLATAGYTAAEKVAAELEFDDDDVESVGSVDHGSLSDSEVPPETPLPRTSNAASQSSTYRRWTPSPRVRTYSMSSVTPSPSRLTPKGISESSSSTQHSGRWSRICRSTENTAATPHRQNSITQNPKRLAVTESRELQGLQMALNYLRTNLGTNSMKLIPSFLIPTWSQFSLM